MSNRAQELIKTYYEEEALRRETEITFSDYSVRLNTSDIAMLEVIAKRFGKSADRIASEAVSAAIYSMVEALEPSERKNMSKEADELNETLAKKAARANGNPDFDEKSVTWVMNDRAITREENKRKKEKEENTPTDSSAHDFSAPSQIADNLSDEESKNVADEQVAAEIASESVTATERSVFAS
ncbi:hypothetical protein [Reinekea sp. G2M2-21]|uniref:hypothetical protein n=1 Tax=Reinekea sp. G2M2-21 TaxID=2788942 RepID=UPI0018A908B4|nr:hypothetical protein [Reinekea sp. G2M2-21]